MWFFEKIPTEELLRTAERRPETLYEMKELEELARRATRAEAPVSIVAHRVARWCADDHVLFGAPPGILGAAVLASSPEPISETFWRAVHEELDARSIDTLKRSLGTNTPVELRPNDSESLLGALDEAWSVRLFSATSSPGVVTAVQKVVPRAVLVEEMSSTGVAEWLFSIPQPAHLRTALRISQEVTRATGCPSACDIPSTLGHLGPDVVAYCSPGQESAVGIVRIDPGHLEFEPIDPELLAELAADDRGL
jgi:hypothetical protein